MGIEVTDSQDHHRFELRVHGRLVGRADYLPAGESIIVTDLRVDEEHQGAGYARLLVRGTLEGIRERGKSVVPTCPFTAGYIRRHPELAEFVHPSIRSHYAASRSRNGHAAAR